MRAEERADPFVNGIAFHRIFFRSRVFRRSHYCSTCIEQEAGGNRECEEKKEKERENR